MCVSVVRPSISIGARRPSMLSTRARLDPHDIVLQLVAMGMLISDSLQLEDLAAACESEQR